MNETNFYYSIYCLIAGVVATYFLYQAWVHKDKRSILVICLMLGLAYSNMLYKINDSLVYDFVKGLTGEMR